MEFVGSEAKPGAGDTSPEAERYRVALHESGHAVVAHCLGYEVYELSVAPVGAEQGHIASAETGFWMVDPATPKLAELWPRLIEAARDELTILFAGSVALSLYTGKRFDSVEGGEGDYERVIKVIEKVEGMRRRPEMRFITDSYKGFLYPGSLRAAQAMLAREATFAGLVLTADHLWSSNVMTREAFEDCMARSHIPRGTRGPWALGA